MVWLIATLVPALLVVGHAEAAQPLAGQATVHLVMGTAILHSDAADSDTTLDDSELAAGSGDRLGVADASEAELKVGDSFTADAFQSTLIQFADLRLPLVTGTTITVVEGDTTLIGQLPQAGIYQLIAGTTDNTVTPDPASGQKTGVITKGGIVSSSGGRFLEYYDMSTATTWAIVLEGTATATAGGADLDIPAGFLTRFPDGGAPEPLQSATRANLDALQWALPPIEALTGAALTDADVLIGPEPVVAETPPPDTVDSGTPPDEGVDQNNQPQTIGGITPLATTATLTAGKTTVWFVPQAVGTLDTLQLADTREVRQGDGVNVSDDGRADLNFRDALKVQIYRHSQLTMVPSYDPVGAIPSLYYDLAQGTTLNAVSSSVWSRLQDARIGVRASGWATITAVFTSHQDAVGALAVPLPGLDARAAFAPLAQEQTGPTPTDPYFLVHNAGSSLLVVVLNGQVQVETPVAAPGNAGNAPTATQSVTVPAGMFTAVDQGQPAEPPRPATRAEIGNRFPTLEELTAGELQDAVYLTGTAISPLASPSAPQVAPAPLPPITIGPGEHPHVAVDADGTAHVVWHSGATSAGDTIKYCRIPPNAPACASVQDLPQIADLGVDPFIVQRPDGSLVVVSERCCYAGPSRVWAILSTDNGAHWQKPVQIGELNSGIAYVRVAPDGSSLDLVSDGAYDLGFQRTSLNGPLATTSINLDRTSADPNDTSVGQYMVTNGFAYLPDGRPIVLMNGQSHLAYRLFQGGSDFYAQAAWKPQLPAIISEVTWTATSSLTSGSRGVFLVDQDAAQDEGLEVRRFDGSDFVAPVPLGPDDDTDPLWPQAVEDPNGTLHVVWVNSKRNLVYRRSDNGTDFSPPVTLTVADVTNESRVFYPALAANAKGAGWVVWEDEASDTHIHAASVSGPQ
jgi:hypothetical protein